MTQLNIDVQNPFTNKRNEINSVLGHDSLRVDYTGTGTTWANEMNIPQVQDRSSDVLTSSPARYHCATDALFYELPYEQLVISFIDNKSTNVCNGI